jgi:hypothetical protein
VNIPVGILTLINMHRGCGSSYILRNREGAKNQNHAAEHEIGLLARHWKFKICVR